MTLTWLDYTVIAGYLLAITAFGSWFARFQKTTRDYFLNDRSVPWWAICFTIVATETSTLSFIGVPAQAVDNIETARRLGAAGIILFSYDSLIDPRQAQPDYMGVVGRSAFAKPAAGAAGTR